MSSNYVQLGDQLVSGLPADAVEAARAAAPPFTEGASLVDAESSAESAGIVESAAVIAVTGTPLEGAWPSGACSYRTVRWPLVRTSRRRVHFPVSGLLSVCNELSITLAIFAVALRDLQATEDSLLGNVDGLAVASREAHPVPGHSATVSTTNQHDNASGRDNSVAHLGSLLADQIPPPPALLPSEGTMGPSQIPIQFGPPPQSVQNVWHVGEEGGGGAHKFLVLRPRGIPQLS